MRECTVRGTLPPLRLHVPPLETGLLPTPTFMKMFPDYVIDVFSLFECQQATFRWFQHPRVRKSVRAGEGGPLRYRTEGRPVFYADRRMRFLRGWTKLFPTLQAVKHI
jgi:hypothetical protein